MKNHVVPFGPLLLCAAAHAQAIDYQNSTNIEIAYPAAPEIADDIHRTSTADIVALDFAYTGADIPDVSFRLRFYENLGLDALPPPLLAEYTLGGLPGEHAVHVIHFELPEPLAAPQDLWIGLLGTNFAAVDFAYPPTIGSSQNYFLEDQDSDGTAETVRDTSFLDSFYLTIYTVPEPGSGTTLATLALVGAARGRRRQP